MPGISLNTPATATFSQIEQRFAMDQGGKDHNIRFQDGKGLYTSDKASLAGVKAFFGFPGQLEARADKREGGVDQIKQAIDREYGPGMGDRVLQHINDEHGIDLSGGIKRSDLGAIREAISDLTLQDKRDAALRDPNISGFTGFMNHTKVQNFITANFDVMASPQFWTHQKSRMNADNLGCSMALNVLSRIQQQGVAYEKDIQDLQVAIQPFVGHGCSQTDPIPNNLGGVVTEPKMQELTQIVFDRFIERGASLPINISGDQQNTISTLFSQPHTSGERITAMHDLVRDAIGSQEMWAGTVPDSLRAIQ